MRSPLARSVRRLGFWLIRLADRIEGLKLVARFLIDLEPEQAMKALRDAERERRGDRC